VLVSRFGILDEDYSGRFCGAAERVYRAMSKAGILAKSADLRVLAAVIFTVSGVRESDVPVGDVCSFFDAEKGAYESIMEAIK